MAQNGVAARPTPSKRLVGRILGGVRTGQPRGTLDVEALRDIGGRAAYQDYAVSRAVAGGEPRRLYRVTTVALGTFPH